MSTKKMHSGKAVKNNIISLYILLFMLLFSASCVQKRVLVSGNIFDKKGSPVKGLEVRIMSQDKEQIGRQFKRSRTDNSGRFSMRIPVGRPSILEVLGDQGAGRKFLRAEDFAGKIDLIYPVTEKVVVLHTNDQHFDLNNLEAFSELVQDIRSNYDDVYLFSAGDVFVRHADRWRVNGRLMEDTAWYGEKSLQMIHAMNELGYDLMTLGNHELAYIANHTRQALEAARFPLLAANFEIATDKLPQPDAYVIMNTSTMRRIAVLGLANDNAKREGIRERNLLETVRNHLSLKDSSDVFLILSHLGLTGDKILAEKFPEPDAIIGGHSHDLLDEPVFINSVLIAQAGGNLHVVSDDHFTYLGKVVFTLENGKITEKRGRVITLVN